MHSNDFNISDRKAEELRMKDLEEQVADLKRYTDNEGDIEIRLSKVEELIDLVVENLMMLTTTQRKPKSRIIEP